MLLPSPPFANSMYAMIYSHTELNNVCKSFKIKYKWAYFVILPQNVVTEVQKIC